ncbi:rhomboid family protein [Scytonema sp. HK-05]|uniref:rhomboid family intramembrane serine protease n=1 Tax=Scytonema sp. HK-05 TaxID=1137095 RepID=UPI000935B703|nr:rhomboid family intramembrane serine protease [Scytonema sp. HK-05]OKH58505.1 rhomboid family intramembrane serine protease [Scytonema sp. HK-05]BAY47023.1 rhomboid family protein [Scytonema sp. HK-05]
MIPISDNIFFFTRRKPIIIYCLIGINIALFLWELKLELGDELGNFVNSLGLVPAQISTASANAVGGNSAAWIVVLMRSTSLLTGMFLHGSFSQILGNLIFLWVFGKTLENILGSRRFLLFYLVAGILTGLVQILAEPSLTVPLIGANGVITAILGAYVFKFPKAKIDTILPLLIIFIPVQLPASFYLFWWFVQQISYGIGSLNIPGGVNPLSIGYLAQIAGLFIGAAFINLLQRF